jgi:HprK-related kinase B
VTKRANAVRLRFGDYDLAFVSDDERLRQRVANYYRSFVAPAPRGRPRDTLQALPALPVRPVGSFTPWDARGKESFLQVEGGRIIRKNRSGVLIGCFDGRWTIAGNLQANFNQIVNLIGALYGMSVIGRGGAMLHASAVVRDDRAIAVLGQSGSGKSSVAVRLLERGFDFLSNDRLILLPTQDGMQAHGLPRLPRVNPGTLLAGRRTQALLDKDRRRRYARLPERELWQLEDKYDLDVSAVLGRAWRTSAPLGCLLVLGWRHDGRSLHIERLDPGQALDALRNVGKSFGPLDLRLAERSDRALLKTVRRTPVYRVTGKLDPVRLARELAKNAEEYVGELA